MKALRAGLLFLFAIILLFLLPSPARAAGTWNYGITAADTPTIIDSTSTTATVDTSLNEIRLSGASNLTNMVAFAPDGSFSYSVLTTTGVRQYVFDAATNSMVENTLAQVSGLTNPLAVAAGGNTPDVVVATGSDIRYYNFNGTNMSYNPALSISGISNAISIGTTEDKSVAALVSGQARRWVSVGSNMQELPMLEPSATLSNPIALATSSIFDMAILEPSQVRYFSFTGGGMTENPALGITGLTNPVAFATADGTETAVIDGSQVRHYSFDGTQMKYNAMLSISSSLTAPKAIAFRPGSYDRIIVDGNTVKYYNYDGTQMVYNASLSKTVADMAAGSGYSLQAVAQSKSFNPGNSATHVRVRAYSPLPLPVGTSVTWAVTADGINWVTKWRVRGTAGGTVTETSLDNGLSWSSVGDGTLATPAVNHSDLWTQVTPGLSVKWKATLSTSDQSQTPKVKAQGGLAVTWEADAMPSLDLNVSAWYYTTSPTFTWTYIDPDGAGDTQSAYQVIITRQSDGAVVYDSAQVMSSANTFTLPNSNLPNLANVLWQSGTYAFTAQVRVWDSKGIPSNWAYGNFKVLAFDRPRIVEIVNPPVGQAEPVLGNTATHLVILPGELAASLPKVKAGARVTIILDSVGPITTPAANVATFPYGSGLNTTLGTTTALNPAGSYVNRYTIQFWTSPLLTAAPANTVVKLQASGTGTEGGTTTFNAPPYADGVVMTEGTIYEDWFVVLQGSDR
ncbi:MAG: glycoside hydrolase family 78 protein [Bacillota bacterium]